MLPIFDLSQFYRLFPEDQQQIIDFIQDEYTHAPVKKQSGLQHFVAQYYQLSERKRNSINTLVSTRYRTNHELGHCYADYQHTTDYGEEQILKMPGLFSKRFIAYGTPEELNVTSYLRFYVDCSSSISTDQLVKEMNDAFLAKAVNKRYPNSKKMSINFKKCRKVSETQTVLLEEMLCKCESELLVDICSNDTIKLTNPWNAKMTMSLDAETGKITVHGNRLTIRNFMRRVNSYF